MELLIFKIDGDNDYGALTFEQSKTPLSEVYKEMLEAGVEVLSQENEDGDIEWRVSLERKIAVTSPEQAQQIIQLLADLTDDDWCGDYDNRKSTNWDSLLLKGGKTIAAEYPRLSPEGVKP